MKEKQSDFSLKKDLSNEPPEEPPLFSPDSPFNKTSLIKVHFSLSSWIRNTGRYL
jgi:hypothetical protein